MLTVCRFAGMHTNKCGVYSLGVQIDGRDAMLELGLACDGGKDSLSMAASAGGETVMAPGNLVVSAYVPCPDITLTVQPTMLHSVPETLCSLFRSARLTSRSWCAQPLLAVLE